MSSEHVTWERLLDLTVYAPLGLALAVRDDLPKFARQGRQALENRVTLARFVGQFAVQQGQRQLAKRIEAYNAPRDAPVDDEPVSVDGEPVADLPVIAGTPAGHDETLASAPEVGTDATMLPITEYESLAASQVVRRLGSLHPDELEAIREFEVAHRARRTVLGKIAQLRGD